MNPLKLRGSLSAFAKGRKVQFLWLAVAVGAYLTGVEIKIHRMAAAQEAIYGRAEELQKTREAALAPKPGEWVSPFCRREYQDFWPDALRNPAVDPICKRQVEVFIAHCQQDAKEWSASWDEKTGNYLHHQDTACNPRSLTK